LPVSGEEALGFGLVDEIVNSAEDLSSRIGAFCKSFRRAAPSAIALAKRASRDMDDIGAFSDCFRTTEAREGMQAFLEKRPAKWMEE
jgi:isohexenylglutaconyl-CoA hydratase